MNTLRVLAVTARTLSFLLSKRGAKYAQHGPVAWTLSAYRGDCITCGSVDTVSLFIDNLEPNTRYQLATDIGDLDVMTSHCEGIVNAVECGVSSDNKDNAEAFANAIKAVPLGGTLRLAAGQYSSGPISLKSNMCFLLDKGAELRAVSDRTNWPILSARSEDGGPLGSWEGLPERCFAALIMAIDCNALTITGRGVIDGGGDRSDWWQWPKETRNGARRPRTMHLIYCDQTTISGVTIRNSPSWTVHPYRCTNLTVSSVEIETPPNSPNTDGLNPESCEDVDITASHFSVGDDCIAIKAGKRALGQDDHLAATRGIHVSHCRMERGHGAVVIGSEMSGGVSDVAISHCEFHSTDRGLRIKTRRGRGGEVSNIVLDNVEMDHVLTPLAINAFYYCDADGHDAWVQSRSKARVDNTTPQINNIRMERVIARGVSLVGAALLGLPEAPIKNVQLKNCLISFDQNSTPESPLMADGVPAICQKDLWTEFAEIEGHFEPICESPETAKCTY